jgi:hypothetical protein
MSEPGPPPRFTTPVAGLAPERHAKGVATCPWCLTGPIHGARQRSKAFHDGTLPICESRQRIARATDGQQGYTLVLASTDFGSNGTNAFDLFAEWKTAVNADFAAASLEEAANICCAEMQPAGQTEAGYADPEDVASIAGLAPRSGPFRGLDSGLDHRCGAQALSNRP